MASLVVDDTNEAFVLIDAVGAAVEYAVTMGSCKLRFQFTFGFQDNQSVVFQLLGSIVEVVFELLLNGDTIQVVEAHIRQTVGPVFRYG